MLWQVILSGFTLGSISSLHCVGMCGPLALSLPIQHLPKAKQVLSLLLYNTGRIITYTTIGLVLGLAGRHLYLAGFQQWFSIALGSVILLLATRYFLQHRIVQPAWMQAYYVRLLQWMDHFIHARTISSYLLLGMVNGLLPCGMVYLAVAAALSTASAVNSALFMCCFGAGTLPAMLALSLFGLRISAPVRSQLKLLTPYITVAMGIVLVLRGMNLGIPFISPVLANAPKDIISCH